MPRGSARPGQPRRRLLLPPALKIGDLVAVATPAGVPQPESVAQAVGTLRSLGLKVLVPEGLFEQRGYLAGSDERRAARLMELFEDPAVRAIVCARGGYGSVRVLDLLSYALIRRQPKILVGFSDITALHLALFSQCGLVGFNGPLLARDLLPGASPYVLEAFRRAVCEPTPLGRLRTPPGARRAQGLVSGKASGPLIGGNLSLVVSLLGTPYLPSLEGAILFLEEVNEFPHRLDRKLWQLRSSGALAKVAGLALGHFTRCRTTRGDPALSLPEIVLDHCGDLHVPIVLGLPFGHVRHFATLPVGVQAELDGGEGLLTITGRATAAR